MNLSNLKIWARLSVAFALILTLLTIVTVISISNMSSMNESTKILVEQDFVKAQLSTEALDNLRGSIARVFEIVSITNDDQAHEARERLKANLGKLDDALTKLEPMLVRAESKEINSRAKETRSLYEADVDKVLALVGAGNRDDATKLAFGDAYKQLHACADALREQLKFQQKRFQDRGQLSQDLFASSRTGMIVVWLIAVLVGVGAAYWITRSITVPVDQAVQVAETIAEGDLTREFTSSMRDETGQLIRALQKMQDSLVDIVGEVNNSSVTIQSATAEISQGTLDLSSRTEMQASALEETASSMEELTSTVRQNADNARQADKMAKQASEVASKGGEAVSHVVATMQAIDASSKKIVDIISVIDGIAFQTNILALNAAVEAARAGEQGRGFAVVASEVRNLAQRSAAAAKEIKELIGDSVEKVETGSRQVSVAGATMDEVVKSITQVTDIMGEITTASQEQSQGIDQINTVIVSMDNTTQQNAALVEEAAAASKALNDQAASLIEVVGSFKIKRGRQAAPAKSPPPPRPAPAPRAKPGTQVAAVKPAPAMIRGEASATKGEEGWEEF